jgi:hypothetical protein
MPDRHQDAAGRLGGVRPALHAAGDTVALDMLFLALPKDYLNQPGRERHQSFRPFPYPKT